MHRKLPEPPKLRSLPKNNQRFFRQASRWFACLLILWIASSCEENCVYHDYRHTSSQGWSNRDTLTFDLPVTDTLATYQVDLEMRNGTEYAYREVYIMVESKYENGKGEIGSANLVCYPLTDRTGKWTGTGWGNTLQSSQPLRLIRFAHSGTLRYKIYHKMNTPLLKGIQDVGIRITKMSGASSRYR